MKKVININLGSVVFAIEQDAYEALLSYLDRIKTNLSSDEDAVEVVADIERAIAEKLIVLQRSERSAVTTADVTHIMDEMGSPSDFADGDGSEASVDAAGTDANTNVRRRLYRDTDDAVIGGVASGVARYFGVDPVVVRLLFVLSVFFSGFGVFVYIVLWLVVPAATTTSDKYSMRGERVTLKDISERVKKNVNSSDGTSGSAAQGLWVRVRDVLDACFRGLGKLFAILATAARFCGGIILVIVGALGIASLVSAYSIILLSDKVFFPAEVQAAVETLQGSVIGIVAMLSSFIMMTIPLIVCVILGAGLLAKQNYFTVQKTVTLAVIWIVAMVVAGTTSALQVEKVMQKIGPVDGRFSESQFEVAWPEGYVRGDDSGVSIHRRQGVSPERLTVTGVYDCLGEQGGVDVADELCVSGLKTTEGSLYSLDFVFMSQVLPPLQVGEIITVSGVFTPTERLSTHTWSHLGAEGVLSVTAVTQGLE